MGKLKEGMIRLSCNNTIEGKSELNRIADFFCPVGTDFYELFNTIQDFIFILNLENKIIFFNRSFKQLEYEESELQGKSILDLYPLERQDEVCELIKNLTPANKSCIHDIPLLKKNGSKFEVETKLILGKWEGNDTIIGICRDSSEKRNYEQELKNSNQQLEMVLLASDAGWWDWVLKDNKLTVNDKWCAMRGYSSDEIIPRVDSWKNLVHPDDYPLVIKNLEKHLRNEIPLYQAEYRIKTKSDGYVWILDTGKVSEFNEDGSPLRVVGINIDINLHKLNELKLQKSLRQQELLSEIAFELNSLENFEKRIQNILQKIGLHTEVSRVYIFEDIRNAESTCNTFEWCNAGIDPQIKELQDIPYEMIPSWKKILTSEGRLYSEDISSLPGDLRVVLEPQGIKSIIIYPIYVQGLFFGFIGFDECVRNKRWTKSELELLRSFSGIVANAYERRISEKSLQESEAKNRAILQSIPDILFHFNKEGKILSYSSSSDEDLALRPDFFVGKLISEIFPEEFSSKVLLAIETCLGKGSYKFEYALQLRGDLKDYEARMSKMSNNEVIAIVRNVSERKNYERQLTAERDRANQANKAKSEFLANMSHEIRTPMNAILGFSEALFHKLEAPQHKKMLQSILSSGNLLLSLLNDILDLSKIEAGMLEISHQPVDLVNIIKEIKLLFLSKAEKKNVEINLYYSDSFPQLLMLDEIRVKQVIFNLVGNAIKFTHSGYVNISLSFEAGPDFCGQLRIDVADTGIGIPESQQQIIFETFKQQSGQSNRVYEGAGLGLAISKRLVEKMNGDISVKSEVGKGSTFSVVLPSSYLGAHDTVIEKSTCEDGYVIFDPCNILVVDDVISNIDAVESLLENSGVYISRAEGGEIALEVLKHMQPQLILLDIRMPDMNGYDVAKKIKEEKRLRNVPIIAFTASVFGTDHGPDSSNFDGFLFKPVDKASLIGEFKKYLKYKVVDSVDATNYMPLASLDSLSPQLKESLPEIFDLLVKTFVPRWDLVKDQLVLYKIEEFAEELKQMADKYEFEFMLRYANRLIEELETVDIEAVKMSLQEFPDIVNSISKLINN